MRGLVIATVLCVLAQPCVQQYVPQQTTPWVSDRPERTIASWYGPGFAGKKTASGKRFNPQHMTAAHKTRPFGSRVKVRNLENNRVVEVTITDRGPYIVGRGIDLSAEAARRLGMRRRGVVAVEVVG